MTMNFICQKDKLIQGINTVQKAVSNKNILPILEGFLLEVGNNKLKLTSNDLELAIEYVCDCDVKTEGKIVVNARMFGEIIKKLQGEKVNIFLDENNLLIIECDSSYFKLVTMNAEEFPKLPNLVLEKSIKIPQNILKEMLKKTIFAVSSEENRPIFTGCLIDICDNILNVVACDGFRLVLQKHTLQEMTSKFYAVIPGKTLNEIVKILEDSEDLVTIGISKNQALFEMNNTIAVTRILEGEFLNYNNAIPQEKETQIFIDKQNFLKALERVSLLIREDDKKHPVKVSIKDNNLIITCNSKTGDAKEEIFIEKVGKDLEISFNPSYLMDSLKAIDDEQICANFGTNVSPCVIKSNEGQNYIHMVLPVRA